MCSALAAELVTAMHGRRRVWLRRLGGVEIALAGMLRGGGVTSVEFLDVGVEVAPGDLVLDPGAHGPPRARAHDIQGAAAGRTAGTLPDAFRDFVAFDLETTGQGRRRLRDRRDRRRCGCGTASSSIEFQSLVQAARADRARAPRRCTATPTPTLAGAPHFEEVWPAFRAFVGDDLLVAHNGHWFDFPILRRMAEPLGGAIGLSRSTTRCRWRATCTRAAGGWATSPQAFGVPLLEAHHALDDAARAGAGVPAPGAGQAGARPEDGLVNLLDWLGLALALGDWATLSDEAGLLLKLTRAWALGRYSNVLDEYAVERERPGAAGAPTHDEVIERLGGREKMLQIRAEKTALDRYPAAMERLGRILDALTGTTLEEQLRELLERVALSRSDGVETDHDRVNLLTLHATKGLEFSRVYIVGVEDAEMPGIRAGQADHQGEHGGGAAAAVRGDDARGGPAGADARAANGTACPPAGHSSSMNWGCRATTPSAPSSSPAWPRPLRPSLASPFARLAFSASIRSMILVGACSAGSP